MKKLNFFCYLILPITFIIGCKTDGNKTSAKVSITTEDFNITVNINSSKCENNSTVVNFFNEERQKIPTVNLKVNEKLNCVAKNHAIYLINNPTDIGHIEHDKNSQYFYADTPSNRAKKAGLTTSFVLETFTYGISNYKKSLYFLYNAIYHRFSMFSPDINLVGQYSNNKVNIFDMSNSYLNKVCDVDYKNNYQNNNYIIKGICKEKLYIPYSDYINSLNEVRKNNPEVIIYPGEKSFAYPVYVYETPDPLNGKYVAGTPITFTLNPYYNKNISKSFIKEFSLIDLSTNEKVEVVEINSTNDKNNLLNEGEFAFYPKKQLKWGNDYKVESVIFNGENYKTFSWIFHTLKSPAPIINVPYQNGSEQQIFIDKGKKYLLYIVPSDDKDVLSGYSYTGDFLLKTDIENYSYIFIEATEGNSGNQTSLIIYSKNNKIRKINLVIK